MATTPEPPSTAESATSAESAASAEPGLPHKKTLSDRLAARKAAYDQRGTVYKVLFIGTGAIITLAGLAMLILPGPALVVIPIGLAMLAMQFTWAERALEKALDHAERATAAAKDTSTTQKVLMGVAIALGVAAFIVAAVLWDIPLLPV